MILYRAFFQALNSTHKLHVPSFLVKKTISDPQGDMVGLMTPLSRSSSIFFLIIAFSKTDILYMPMFGRGDESDVKEGYYYLIH